MHDDVVGVAVQAGEIGWDVAARSAGSPELEAGLVVGEQWALAHERVPRKLTASERATFLHDQG